MKRTERLALVVVLAILAGVPAAVFGYQALRGPSARGDEVFVVARVAERGGFTPGRIVVKHGARVRLRILAEDVTHGFQLLHFGADAGAIKTGTTKVVEFTADKTGEFPFYCSVRCSPLHMALMGTLVVEAREHGGPRRAPQAPPTLGAVPGNPGRPSMRGES